LNLKLNKMSSHFLVKQFSEEDILGIYEVCKRNPTYYHYLKTKPTFANIKDVFTELPPNKALEDKLFIGFYSENHLIALMDFVVGYPDIHTVFIGWFMMNKEYQGRGTGTEIITEFLNYLKKEGYMYVELGYIKGNRESEQFWIKNSFKPTGVETSKDKYKIILMRKEL
jgi:RimJ/RimL family protein N-acetyltransferase